MCFNVNECGKPFILSTNCLEYSKSFLFKAEDRIEEEMKKEEDEIVQLKKRFVINITNIKLH